MGTTGSSTCSPAVLPDRASRRTCRSTSWACSTTFAIGENSVDDAFKTLKAAGRLDGVRCDDSTKIGKDGKGQFNMYDPDGIRAELMNFHATEKPCCSEFTAADPAE